MEKKYFITFTIAEWVKVLEYGEFKNVIINSIKFYPIHKVIVVYSCCIMLIHLHMKVQVVGKFNISEILRYLKKITSRSIVGMLEDQEIDGNEEILNKFSEAGKPVNRIMNFKVWQDAFGLN